MSSESSENNVPSPTGNSTISDATAKAVAAKNAAYSSFIEKMIKHAKRYNTPFDGRKRNEKVAKARRSRKANKKRKLYLRRRDGK